MIQVNATSIPAGNWFNLLVRQPSPRAVMPASTGTGFRRDRLPDPLVYYANQGLKLIGRGKWRPALCVFHKESRPSFAVCIENGAFRCHACGVRGQDVLAFHQQFYGMGFREAAMDLGAWEVSHG